MRFQEIQGFLTKCGYTERECDNHHSFYEFGTQDFLYSEVAKRFSCDVDEKGNTDKVILTQYWFGTTTFKEITDINGIYDTI